MAHNQDLFLLRSFETISKASLQPPPAGTNPTIVSTNPITILVCETTKLLCNKTSSPPPKANPEGADTTGLSQYFKCLTGFLEVFNKFFYRFQIFCLTKSIT